MKSPISLPLGLSIGDSVIRPWRGMRLAITWFSQASALGPVTSYLPKLCTSLMPTAVRTASHSAFTASQALERRKVGVSYSGSPSGAK